MEPEELSRELGKILGSKPYTMEERDRINEAFGEDDVDSFDDLPDDIQQLLNRPLPDYTKPNPTAQSRSLGLSKVDRSIIKDSDKCPLCVANNDPKNVPVHPNCHCDVVTNSIETAVADAKSRFLQAIRTDQIATEMVGDGELPASVQIDGNTVSIMDLDDVRFADFLRWLEQMQPFLEQGANYISIVVDPDSDEAVQQIEELADIVSEDSDLLAEALQNKKLWFSLAQAVI